MTTQNETKRPIPDSRREQMARILTIATQIPKHVADVFVNFSAHVNMIQVDIHASGWAEDSQPETLYSYLDEAESIGESTSLESILERLQSLTKAGGAR